MSCGCICIYYVSYLINSGFYSKMFIGLTVSINVISAVHVTLINIIQKHLLQCFLLKSLWLISLSSLAKTCRSRWSLSHWQVLCRHASQTWTANLAIPANARWAGPPSGLQDHHQQCVESKCEKKRNWTCQPRPTWCWNSTCDRGVTQSLNCQ